jgi:signal transduction histidine kinase
MSNQPPKAKKMVFPSPFAGLKKKDKRADVKSDAAADKNAAERAASAKKKDDNTLDLLGTRKKGGKSGVKSSFPLAPVALVIGGIAASFFLFRQLSSMHDRDVEATFQQVATSRAADIRQSLTRAEETVATVALLAKASGDVRAYNAGVQAAMARHPHILAMAWLENYIPDMSAITSAITPAKAKPDAAPMLGEIAITARGSDGNFGPSPVKPFYLPLVNLQINGAAKPAIDNALAEQFTRYVGYDFSSDAGWQRTFTEAGAKSVAQFVPQGLGKNDRLLLQRVSNSDGKLMGYVVAVLSLDQLIADATKNAEGATATTRLFEPAGTLAIGAELKTIDRAQVTPIYPANGVAVTANADADSGQRFRARFTQFARVPAFGREWVMEFEPSTNALRTRDSALPALIGLLGLLGTLVGTAAVVNARKRAQISEIKLAEAKLDLMEARDQARDSDKLSMQAEQELAGAFKQLRDAELQQMQNEKMSALGVMVAGVAHEINTPLGFVSSNVEYMGELTESIRPLIEMQHRLMDGVTNWATMTDVQRHAWYNVAMRSRETLRELKERDALGEISELVGESTSGLERISEIVSSLKDFSRVDRAQVDAVNLHQGIDSTLIIAQNVTKHKADVVKNYGEIPLIPCSPSQINQVILNLVSNAAQAIPEFGTITISTRVDGEFVAVDIEDNGSGMSEEVSSQIFKPFFTTKGAGEGTGLGLAICEKIISAHKGTIGVKSEVGVGTTFTIRLPINAG